MISLKELSIAFAAGALGGFILTVILWMESHYGIDQSLHIRLPDITGHHFVLMIYKMMTWGGIWALLLLIPYAPSKWFLRGIVFSLIPSFVMFLYFAPESGMGYFAFDAGYLMPLQILLLNALWGIIASWWYHTFKS